MADYSQLTSLLLMGSVDKPETDFNANVVPYLVDRWLDEYTFHLLTNQGVDRPGRLKGVPDIVETSVSGFSYLFDIDTGRLIAAWGISKGKNTDPRPDSRMRGHPLGSPARGLYHRGHAIPHTLGGGTDINLVAQLGKVNTGPFRELEIKAVGHPGSFYFTYWSYFGSRPVLSKTGRLVPGQVPTGVEQGLLIPGQDPLITHHAN